MATWQTVSSVSDTAERRREKQREWARNKRAMDPEWAERARARERARYATDAAYRERVQTSARERARRRYAEDAEYRERLSKRRKALRAGPGGAKRQRANNLRKYGLSLADYDALLESVGGRCQICATVPNPPEVLVVDHDHATGTVRGLLCRNCNLGIGLLRDDPGQLRAALVYLEVHSGNVDHDR